MKRVHGPTSARVLARVRGILIRIIQFVSCDSAIERNVYSADKAFYANKRGREEGRDPSRSVV